MHVKSFPQMLFLPGQVILRVHALLSALPTSDYSEDSCNYGSETITQAFLLGELEVDVVCHAVYYGVSESSCLLSLPF
jgi:hypothetical protein